MRNSIFIIGLFACITTNAQTQDNHFNTWWANISSVNLNDKLFAKNELHVRRNEGVANWQQFLVRPSLQYRLKDNLILAAGYSYLINYPYGINDVFTGYEHNFWEQALVKNQIGKTRLVHRYRMEHRYPALLDEQGEIIDYGFINRFRYRLTLKRSLGSESSWSIVAFDEAFLSFEGSGLTPAGLDQNWIYLGLNYAFNDNVAIEIAYMNQYLKRSESLREYNHTLSSTLKLSF